MTKPTQCCTLNELLQTKICSTAETNKYPLAVVHYGINNSTYLSTKSIRKQLHIHLELPSERNSAEISRQ